MDKLKVLLIETTAPDNADYEHVIESAISNTVQEYFTWMKESNIEDVEFKIYYPEGNYYTRQMKVYAEFKNETDMAEFKLLYQWNLPKKQLSFKDSMIFT